MVVVEYHDSAHHRAGHHDHDAGKVGSYERGLTTGGLHVWYLQCVWIHIIEWYNFGDIMRKLTMFMNIVRDISTVISRVTFSPESGGKLNPSTAMLTSMIYKESSTISLPWYKNTGANKIWKVVQGSSSDLDEDCNVNVGLWTALIKLHIPDGGCWYQLPFTVVLIIFL